MPDRSLVEHIKKRLRHGHDIKLIRDQLLKTGFPYLDVHEAIDLAFKDLRKGAKEAKKEAKKEENILIEILRPSKRKFILPIIILLILLLHFLGNVSYLPSIGRKLCSVSELEISLEKAIETNSTNIEELQNNVWEHQVDLIGDFKILLFFNFPFMASRVYRFNPFFPTPCELAEFAYTP